MALRKHNECKEDVLSERQKQFLEILRAKDKDNDTNQPEVTPTNAGPSLPATASATTMKPIVKTYTRKTAKRPIFKKAVSVPPQPFARPAPPVPVSMIEYLKFVPPNLNTLVAIRGLSLLSKTLRSKPDYEDTEDTDSPMFSGLRTRDHLDATPRGGRLSVREADKLLRDRLVSLFFWPTVMSKVPPNERKDVFDIFEDTDDTVAACNPLDVQEIIEDAQAKTANTPRVVVGIRKRKQDKPQQRVTFANDEPATESEFVTVAPPPYKKRLLVASTSSSIYDD